MQQYVQRGIELAHTKTTKSLVTTEPLGSQETPSLFLSLHTVGIKADPQLLYNVSFPLKEGNPKTALRVVCPSPIV